MTPVRFAVVGGGWRALFYLRIARALPERFRAEGLVVRHAARGEALSSAWGVPTFRTLDELLAHTRPGYVVTSVPWEANPSLLSELTERGLPALSETPPAPGLERLRQVWALAERGARIQVAEQYLYQPQHAARLALVQSGLLGPVSQAQVSAAHGYHGLSLLRRYLGVRFENARIRALGFTSALMAGPDRAGPPREERVGPSSQVIAWLEFGGKLGVYDFSGDQYFSWVRGQRLLVRGERGEIINERASYLRRFDEPVYLTFERQVAGANGNLEGCYLKGITAGEQWWYRNPFAPGTLSDDEIAVATSLERMAEYVEGGAEPYPLADACQDRYLDTLIEQAVQSGGPVVSETQAWAIGS